MVSLQARHAKSTAPPIAPAPGPDRAAATPHNPLWQALATRASGHSAEMPPVAPTTDPREAQADRIASRLLGLAPRVGESESSPSPGAWHTDGAPIPGGEPLSPTTRQWLEPGLGRDLGTVRIHRDTAAADQATSLGARAFTIGQSIVFGRGEYDPASPPGAHLLAHEVAHTLHDGGRRMLFRKPKAEPHYPTPDEQRAIETILSRRSDEEAEPTAATAKGETTKAAKKPQSGRSLDAAQRTALAAELYGPFWQALDALPDAPAEKPVSAEAGLDLVERAHRAVIERYGAYTSRRLTSTRDNATTVEQRRKTHQILITVGAKSDKARALAYTVITTHCGACRAKLAGLDEDSADAVKAMIINRAAREEGARLEQAAADHVAGSHGGETAEINVILQDRDQTYHSAIHEWIHAYTHPAFDAAFNDERYILDGFTEYFTGQIAQGTTSYRKAVAAVKQIKSRMSGPFTLGSLHGEAVEASLRLAYFGGRLDLIGWQPSDEKERKAVEQAGGAPEWDSDKAASYAKQYHEEAIAAQGANRNILGVGVFFGSHAPDDFTLSVRYARVLAQSSPYAKGRLLYEGQLVGSPAASPATLGAGIGIAGEYQEPNFYVGGGMRLIGNAALGPSTTTGLKPDPRVDFSPFAGIGVRLWRSVRVGGEGFVLLPVTGQSVSWGAGAAVSVEL